MGKSEKDWSINMKDYKITSKPIEKAPDERRKLQLTPSAKPYEPVSSLSEALDKSLIFGAVKPVHTAAKEREIDERLNREKKKLPKDPRQTGEERIRKCSYNFGLSNRSRLSSDSFPSGSDKEDEEQIPNKTPTPKQIQRPQDRKKILLGLQEKISLINHCINCHIHDNIDKIQCSVDGCGPLKKLLNHNKLCSSGRGCKVKDCFLITKCLSHMKNRKECKCKICGPIKKRNMGKLTDKSMSNNFPLHVPERAHKRVEDISLFTPAASGGACSEFYDNKLSFNKLDAGNVPYDREDGHQDIYASKEKFFCDFPSPNHLPSDPKDKNKQIQLTLLSKSTAPKPADFAKKDLDRSKLLEHQKVELGGISISQSLDGIQYESNIKSVIKEWATNYGQITDYYLSIMKNKDFLLGDCESLKETSGDIETDIIKFYKNRCQTYSTAINMEKQKKNLRNMEQDPKVKPGRTVNLTNVFCSTSREKAMKKILICDI